MAAYDWDEYLEKAKKIDNAKAAAKPADPMQDLYSRAKWLDETRANPTPVARKEVTAPVVPAGSSAKGGFSTGAMRASANGGGVLNAPAVVNAQKQASAWDNENRARFGNIRSAADYKEKSAALLSPAEEKRKENYNRLMALAGRRTDSPVTGFSTNDRKALYELAPQGGIVNREKLERSRAEQTVDALKSLKATDEEIADFIYLQNTRGDEEAAAYFEWISPQLNARQAAERKAAAQKRAQESPVAESIISVPANVLGGAVGAADLALQELERGLDTLKGETAKPIDYNRAAQALTDMAGTTRQTVSEGIENPVGKFLYDVGMSMADSAAVMALGAAGIPNATALLGTSAATSAAKEAKARGASDEQALIVGAAAGIAEGVFEKYSIDRLFEMSSPATIRAAVANIAKQSLTEASEEAATSVANAIVDAIVMADKSAYRQSVAAYIAGGYSEEEAKKAAALEVAKQVGMDALAGAVSGGIFGAGGNIVTSVGNRFQNNPAAAEGNIDPLAEIEKGLEPEVDPLAELEQGLKSETDLLEPLKNVEEGSIIAEKSAESRREDETIEEDFNSFIEREESAGKEIILSGRSLVSYNAVAPEKVSFNAQRTVDDIKALGGRAIVYDGPISMNTEEPDGKAVTRINNAAEAVTLPDGTIAVRNDILDTAAGKRTAAHETLHSRLIQGDAAAKQYLNAVTENIDRTNEDYKHLLRLVEKVYGPKGVEKVKEETAAYIAGEIYSGAGTIDKDLWFVSPDAVEVAWQGLYGNNQGGLQYGRKEDGNRLGSRHQNVGSESGYNRRGASPESGGGQGTGGIYRETKESIDEQNYSENVPAENDSEKAAAIEPDYSTEGELRQAKADNHNTEKWSNYAKAWGELSQRYGTTDDAEIAARATKEEYDELGRLYDEAEEDRVNSLLQAMDERAAVERTRLQNRVTNESVREMIADDENAIIRPEVTVDAKAVAGDSEADIKAAADEGRADPTIWITNDQTGMYNKGIARVLDAVSKGEKGLDAANYGKRRNTLYEVFERPLYRAKARYARNVTRKMTELAKKADELGIKTGTPEAEAVTWIGEGQRQIISPKAKEPQMVEYTETDLIEQFGDRAGAIMEMAGYLRTMYDDLYKDYDRMIRQIYPSVEAIVKKAEESKTWHEQRVNYYQTQALVQTEAAEEYRARRTKIAQQAESAAEPGIKAALKNRANELEQLAMQADTAARRFMGNAKRSANFARKWQDKINSGELWKNKRLPYRQNYFPHYEKRGGFVSDLLSAATGERISSGLAGTSEWTKPKSIFWRQGQRRSDDSNMIYEADALAAAKRYIQEAEERIAIDPVIAQMRGSIIQLAEATADTRSANNFLTWATDWTNDLAHKTNPADRFFNKLFGRGFVPVLRVINNRVKANAVVGNIGSAIVQIGNLPNASMYVTNPNSWLWATRQMAEGSALAQKLRGNGEAIDPQQMSPFLQERYLNRATDLIDDRSKVEKAANWLLEVGDRTAAELTWLAAYHQYENGGAGNAAMREYVNAIDYADDITRRSIGGRGIGELPLTQKSEFFKLVAPFQVEVNNTYQAIKEQAGRHNAKGLINYALTAALVNAIIEAVRGSKPLFDPIDALIDAFKIATDEEEEKTGTEKAAEIAVRLLGEGIAAAPYAQPISTIVLGAENSEKLFGENDPTRYGTGMVASSIVEPAANLLAGQTIDPLEGLFDVVPKFGGAQLKRMYQMGQNVGVIPEVRLGVKEGLSFERTSEGFAASETNNGGIRFPIETDPLNLLQGMAFGQYATREGREYIEEGRSPMSDTASQKYAAAVAGGVDPAVYYAAYLAQKGIQGDKDSNGDTLYLSPSRNKKAAIDAVLTPDVTTAQRHLIYEAFGVSKQVW